MLLPQLQLLMPSPPQPLPLKNNTSRVPPSSPVLHHMCLPPGPYSPSCDTEVPTLSAAMNPSSWLRPADTSCTATRPSSEAVINFWVDGWNRTCVSGWRGRGWRRRKGRGGSERVCGTPRGSFQLLGGRVEQDLCGWVAGGGGRGEGERGESWGLGSADCCCRGWGVGKQESLCGAYPPPVTQLSPR